MQTQRSLSWQRAVHRHTRASCGLADMIMLVHRRRQQRSRPVSTCNTRLPYIMRKASSHTVLAGALHNHQRPSMSATPSGVTLQAAAASFPRSSHTPARSPRPSSTTATAWASGAAARCVCDRRARARAARARPPAPTLAPVPISGCRSPARGARCSALVVRTCIALRWRGGPHCWIARRRTPRLRTLRAPPVTR